MDEVCSTLQGRRCSQVLNGRSARTSGVRASLATVWLPVSALALSVGLLGESVRAWQWAGLGCVLAAMVLAATATATGKESG